QLAAQSEVVRAELETGRALVAQLRQQIEAEKSERAKLFAIVQTVQRALSSAKTFDSAETVGTGSLASTLDDRESIGLADRALVRATPETAKILAGPDAIAKEARVIESADQTPAPEKLWNPTLVAITERLFEEIERKYQLEAQPNVSPAVVDRLLASLRI